MPFWRRENRKQLGKGSREIRRGGGGGENKGGGAKGAGEGKKDRETARKSVEGSDRFGLL